MSSLIGQSVDRVDGRLKVTGGARYSAEFELPGVVHAMMVQSAIASGRIVTLETGRALQVPGVLAVLTHLNAPRLKDPPELDGPVMAADARLVLQDDVIRYSGQPIALVVADTFERATYAASLVRAQLEPSPPVLSLEAHLDEQFKPHDIFGEPPDQQRGDLEAGLAMADAVVEATYSTPAEHHNPIEAHATTADWDGETLTLYDSTQWINGVRLRIAGFFGLDPERVRTVSHFVGGGFGSKGTVWPHVVLAAMATRAVNRPVKLVVNRHQLFGSVGFRPQTRQRLRLGAKSDGTLTAIGHDGVNQTSMFSDFTEPVGLASRILYACPNLSVTHRLVRLNTPTPTFMRAPGRNTGVFALECAMDELAYQLKMDPLELRLKNDADRDPDTGQPWSSKSLKQCYLEGAERFGWARRNPEARSMRDGRHLVGWGMATATYPTHRSAASARAILLPDGFAIVRSATHDLGTGAYTILTQIAAETLDVPMDRVRFELGDTDYPWAPVTGGSQTTASVGPAVQSAVREALDKVLRLALQDPASPLHGRLASDIGYAQGRFFLRQDPSRGETFAEIIARRGLQELSAEATAEPGDEEERYSMHAFGAQFAEVHVDPDLGEIRVTRYVGRFCAGRIVNRKTARSQLYGGITMGIGMALMEQSVRDPKLGCVVNSNLAEYLIPVHADVPELDADFVPEEDAHVNPLGAKGLGELGIVGAAAAIANAVYHATGVRIRELPITLDKLVGPTP